MGEVNLNNAEKQTYLISITAVKFLVTYEMSGQKELSSRYLECNLLVLVEYTDREANSLLKKALTRIKADFTILK